MVSHSVGLGIASIELRRVGIPSVRLGRHPGEGRHVGEACEASLGVQKGITPSFRLPTRVQIS